MYPKLFALVSLNMTTMLSKMEGQLLSESMPVMVWVYIIIKMGHVVQIHLSRHVNGFVLYFLLHLLAHSITKHAETT